MTVRNPSFAAPSLAGMNQQYNTLLNSLNGGIYGTQDYFAKQKQLGNLSAQMQAQGVQDGAQALSAQSGGPNDLAAQRQKNFQSALADTEGRGDAVMNDPYMSTVLAKLQGNMSGGPYTDQVQNQMIARQADAGAAGMDAQRQMIESQQTALGGSMADPSAQAALRRLVAQNQQQNNANIGDVQTKAALANYGAQNDAAMNLAGVRSGQLGQANSQYNQASNLYANQQINGNHFDAVQQPAMYGGGGNGAIWGGGGSFTPFTGSPLGYAQTTSGNALGGNYQRPAVQAAPAATAGYSNSPVPSIRPQGPAAPHPTLTAGQTNWSGYGAQPAPPSGTGYVANYGQSAYSNSPYASARPQGPSQINPYVMFNGNRTY
jgi:hypothetical protein